jgi:methylenetetrahydrofolate dehydrogenase (NADP+)/methenyltetrahydrofolate cyclohydrolase
VSATVIDGSAIAAEIRAEVAAEVAALVAAHHPTPGLATILVGDDPGSAVYVAMKRRLSVAAGIADLHQQLPAGVSQDAVAEVIRSLNEDPQVSGILLQLPLPAPLDAGALIELIAPEKDVDGLTAVSVGRLVRGLGGLAPCTPRGVIALLDRHGVVIEGAEAVVVGRSDLVGTPTAALLLARHATVTTAHSRTRDLAAVTRRADILVVAAGVPGLIGADHVKPGAVVIDVGTTRLESGVVGDVDFAAVTAVAGLITPVPGGVGPLTIAMLLSNTVIAAKMQFGDPAALS